MSPQGDRAGPYRRDSRHDGFADSRLGNRRRTQRSPDVWTKAAALLQSIVSNYALIDLNERLVSAVFLQLNGVDVNAAAPTRYSLVMRSPRGQTSVEDLAAHLARLLPEASDAPLSSGG
jgi:prophage maintenance system killer protein